MIDLQPRAERFFELVAIEDLVDQAGFLRGGGAEQALVEERFDLVVLEMAVLGDRGDQVVIDVVDDRLQALAQGRSCAPG